MKALLLMLSLLTSAAVFAQAEPDPRLLQLDAAYNRVHQEQQAVYQQFLMSQELRRNELQELSPSVTRNYSTMGTDTTRPLDYDENVRLQRARQERLQRYDRDVNEAYTRYLELGRQKQQILDQIRELTTQAPRR